jgi:type IV secretory pathway VirJ component
VRAVVAFLAGMAMVLPVAGAELHEQQLKFGRFGTVTVYSASAQPHAVALFVSGDGGWNQGVVDMARTVASLDTLAVGIDIRSYLKALAAGSEACSYPASDFEGLSQYVQQQLHFSTYVTPLLIGYSSGATLVYATLVQAPPGTFAGAISLGFCPDLMLAKPMCRGHGLEWVAGPKGHGVDFLPASTLEQPWIAFQGVIDQVCDPAGTESFVAKTAHGEVVMLAKVGHGYSVPRNWEPQFKQALVRLAAPPPSPARPEAVSDLPLVEVAATGTSPYLAVILSGDGGWASLDKEVAGVLAVHGVPVVGLNCLQYFWRARTPDGLATDLARVLHHYMTAWGKDRVVLAGYSFGAEVLPFAANRLPQPLRDSVALVALLGPSPKAEFEFHIGDWLGHSASTAQPVAPELGRLKPTRVLCFYSESEADSPCREVDPAFGAGVGFEGGHHFGGAYREIGDRILADLEGPAATPPAAVAATPAAPAVAPSK